MSDVRAVLRKAESALKRGRADQSLALTSRILAGGEGPSRVLELHASACARLGRLEEAIAATEKVIQTTQATLERVLFYGDLLLRARRWQAAADVFQQVLKKDDSQLPAWLGLGHCLLGSGDPARAAQCYLGVLERQPDHYDATLRLGICQLSLGEFYRSLALFERLAERGKTDPEFQLWYGDALWRVRYWEEAAEKLEPLRDHPAYGRQARAALAALWSGSSEPQKARPFLDPLLRDEPDNADLLLLHARLLAVEGEQQAASEALTRILDEAPYQAVAWEQFLDLSREPLSADRLRLLEKMRDRAVRSGEKVLLSAFSFALARHYQLAGEFTREFEALERANECAAALNPYDSERHYRRVMALQPCYTARRIRAMQSTEGDRGRFRPVFVLCPPRSGSTLLEQALGQHSRLAPAGELPFPVNAWRKLTGERDITRPDTHEGITAGEVSAFARYFLEDVRNCGFATDDWMIYKGINSYKFAGLLKAAFPRACFIDLRRHPLDVAFGCYRQHFAAQPFSNTPAGCASEIALFQSNMRWWHEQIPESIYTVHYEDLVDDFESVLRGLLAWLGLPWEAACLDIGKSRQVTTASINQVRQGLFREGVGRHKQYGEALAPLREALEAAGVLRDDAPPGL